MMNLLIFIKEEIEKISLFKKKKLK